MKCLEVRWNIKLYIYMQKVLEYSTNIQRLYQVIAKSAKVKKCQILAQKSTFELRYFCDLCWYIKYTEISQCFPLDQTQWHLI